jgi:hypothetical protein
MSYQSIRDGCVFNFFGPGDPGPTGHLTTLCFILWPIITNRSLSNSHQTNKISHFLTQNAFTRHCILKIWLPFACRLGIWGPHGLLASAYLNWLSCIMPNTYTIFSISIWLSEYTRSRALLHNSLSMTSSGRPYLASSSKDKLISPTQNLT